MEKQILSLIIFFLIHSSLYCNIPQSVSELWKNYDARKDPLKTEIIKSWQEDHGNFKLIRYSLGKQIGSQKITEPKIAAYYGAPQNAKNCPAIVNIHGGGQRASLSKVKYWVSMGYAAISINWGGKVLDQPDTPNTDWDGLAAGFIGDKTQTHHNEIAPNQNTLFKEPHPFNSSWTLIAKSGRRAITFLEQQSEVDKNKIGVEGHSMGGRSTSYVAIDPRIKAAAPSVGGSGYLYEDIWGLPGSARSMKEHLSHYKATISSQNYWSEVTCPVLFLGSTNDFNSPTELVLRGLSHLPASTQQRLVLAPHLNHRFTDSTQASRILWMESHLKQNMVFPKTSKAVIELDTQNKIPLFKVWPDTSTTHKLHKVDIYYGYARDPRIRFWRDAEAKKVGGHFEAACPIFDTNEPLFAFANITYDTGKVIPMPRGRKATSLFTISSEYQTVFPSELKKNNISATEKPKRVIDNFSRGWHDWYTLSIENHQHWFASTRKVVDPSWMAPKGAKLALEIITSGENNLMLVILEQNTWQSYTGRTRDTFYTTIELPNHGLNSAEIKLHDFKNAKGESLKVWNESTELSFSATAYSKIQNIKRREWQGKAPEFKALSWVGGKYSHILHPHQPRQSTYNHNALSFESEFQNSIQDSIELEQLDKKLN